MYLTALRNAVSRLIATKTEKNRIPAGLSSFTANTRQTKVRTRANRLTNKKNVVTPHPPR